MISKDLNLYKETKVILDKLRLMGVKELQIIEDQNMGTLEAFAKIAIGPHNHNSSICSILTGTNNKNVIYITVLADDKSLAVYGTPEAHLCSVIEQIATELSLRVNYH